MGLELGRAAPERAVASPRENNISEAAASAYKPRVTGEPITDLAGRTCKMQPDHGEIPTLALGSKNNGCTYEKGGSTEIPPLNTAALYEQALHQAVKLGVEFKKGFATGSGVMVGKGDDVCYVATDYHNFAADKGDALKRVETKVYGGKRYDATIAASDPANDIALLAVRTGADTAAVCQPAVVVENPAAVRGAGVTFGFPKEARTLYASPTEFLGTESLQSFMSSKGPKRGRPMFSPGENPRRDILNTTARTHQGNSGGPMYNAAGEVVGLLGGGVPNDARISYGNVLTRATVDRWLEQVLANSPKR